LIAVLLFLKSKSISPSRIFNLYKVEHIDYGNPTLLLHSLFEKQSSISQINNRQSFHYYEVKTFNMP